MLVSVGKSDAYWQWCIILDSRLRCVRHDLWWGKVASALSVLAHRLTSQQQAREGSDRFVVVNDTVSMAACA